MIDRLRIYLQSSTFHLFCTASAMCLFYKKKEILFETLYPRTTRKSKHRIKHLLIQTFSDLHARCLGPVDTLVIITTRRRVKERHRGLPTATTALAFSMELNICAVAQNLWCSIDDSGHSKNSRGKAIRAFITERGRQRRTHTVT